MRDIKFRLWIESEKRMLGSWDLATMCNDEFSHIVLCEVMQYTGLKDKNGKEIYALDLIKDEDGNVHKVVWGYFTDCCVDGETWILEGVGYQPTVYYHHEDIEVIGNIYENPELLRG